MFLPNARISKIQSVQKLTISVHEFLNYVANFANFLAMRCLLVNVNKIFSTSQNYICHHINYENDSQS